MKKLVSVMLSAVMLLSVLTGVTFTASAAELTDGTCGSGVKYSFGSDKTLTISGSGYMTDFKKKSESPFSSRNEIEKVVIENGVQNIGTNAFWDCKGIKSVAIPSSVKAIGEYAFWDCSKLAEITIPKTVKHIGYNAFAYTGYYNNDKNWELGVLYAGDCIVATNDVLTGACTVKSGTRLIAQYAFFDAEDLTSLTLPESVTYIDEGTFMKCVDLVSVKLPSSIKSIGYKAFCDCESLKKLSVPSSVSTIGESAFMNCASMTGLVLNEGVKTVGKYAFNCCDSLKTVKLPLSLKKIKLGAFYPCAGLKNVYYPGTKAQLDKIKVEKSNGPLFRATVHCKDDVKGLKLKAKKRSFKASWKKVKGAKKYEVMYSRSKDMSKAVTVKTKNSKTALTVKKLKAGKKYYVCVRAIRGKEKSQWTKAKAVKVK